MNTKAEVMENLVLADQYINKLFPGLTNLKLVIIGGASFLLKGFENKFTLDIDTLTVLDDHVQEYLESFGINNAALMSHKISETYENRLIRVKGNFKVLEAYVISNEDLILTKLNRSSYDDLLDITSSGILDVINIELLEEIASGMCQGDDVYRSKWEHFRRNHL